MLTASFRDASPPSRSPQRTRAIPCRNAGAGVTMLCDANLRMASSASASICLTPRRHKKARITAAHASAEGSPGRAGSPYCQRSAASAHRSASAGRPVNAEKSEASTATIGCPSVPPRSSSHRSHRRTVGDPALPVGRHPELFHQASGRIDVPSCHRVLQCYLGQVVSQAPVGGAAVQDRDQVGLQALQFRQQHVAEQVVVAVPLPRRSSGTSSRFDRASSARVAADPGSRAPHRTAARTCAPAPRSGSGIPAADGRSAPGTPTPCTRSPAGPRRRRRPPRSPAGRPP